MLGKIIKYEFKATSKNYLISFLAVIALSALSGLIQYLPEDVAIFALIKGAVYFVYFALVVMMPTAVMIALGVRFFKSMLSDTAYFTHTIPVGKKTLINGKIVSGVIWMVLSIVVVIVSVAVMVMFASYSSEMAKHLREIIDAIRDIRIPSEYISTVFIVVILSIVAVFVTVLHIYASVAMGQILTSHKKIGAVVFYVILRYVASVIMTAGMFVILNAMDMLESNFDNASDLNILLLLIMLFMVIFGVICYVITYEKFNKFDLD